MPNTHSTLRGLFSDIADAIREKDGSSGTIVADTFPAAIRAIPTGGGGGAEPSLDDITVTTLGTATAANDVINFTYDVGQTGAVLTRLCFINASGAFGAMSNTDWYSIGTNSGWWKFSNTVLNGSAVMFEFNVDGLLVYVEFNRRISGTYGVSKGTNDVEFIDYDGTVVLSYKAAAFANVTKLPDNPSHDGLTAQGWNWSLSDAKTYVASYGKLIVGQMYITDDGKTRIYIRLEDGRLSPMLGVCPNGTVTVDWGDGSATTKLTGTSVSTVKWTSAHTYAAAGEYVIALTVSGSFGFYGASSNLTGTALMRYSSAADEKNYVYRSSIRRVEIGNGVTSIGTAAFGYSYNLANITIPSSVTSIGQYAFQHCYSLASVTIPSSVTSIDQYGFFVCYGIKIVAFPRSITRLTNNAFKACYSLANVTIPSRLSIPGSNAFETCYSLTNVTIPSSVTNLQKYVFNGCYSLASVTIPSSVTTINNYAFQYCYGLSRIIFKRTSPATVSGGLAWNSVPTDCKIYVPSSALSAYKSATNYPDPTKYTYVGY